MSSHTLYLAEIQLQEPIVLLWGIVGLAFHTAMWLLTERF